MPNEPKTTCYDSDLNSLGFDAKGNPVIKGDKIDPELLKSIKEQKLKHLGYVAIDEKQRTHMKEPAGILTEDEIRKAIPKIFKRSQTDREFRKLCLSNPARAIQEVSGKSLPEWVTVQFLDTMDDEGNAEAGSMS